MKKKAFTLVELAITLTIVGLLLGGSLQVMKAMREKTKVSEAKKQLKEARDAVIGYAIRYPNLPDNSTFQQELTPIKSGQNPIFYIADSALSTNDICAYDATSLKIVKNEGATQKEISDIAFVLVHESTNYNMQTALNSSNEVHVYLPHEEKDDNTTLINRVEAYDDVVEWVRLDELKQNVNCVEHKVVILNDHALPRDNNNTPYQEVKIFADKGFPFPDDDGDNEKDYKWCVEGSNDLNNWLEYTCNGTHQIDTNCSNVTPTTYKRCTTPALEGTSGTNSEEGTHRLKIYVKDKRDKIEKSFSIAIDSINTTP